MPSDRESILRLEGVCLGYSADVSQRVLEDVDLDVARGEFWFVLGPNGSGKTTLLRAVLGLLEPLSGRLWRHPDHAAPSRLGFVPQHCALSPALPTTVRELVSLGATHGDRPGHLQEDLAWALERTGIADLASRDFWSLSGGQRRRALVARALVRRPSLLVLDEATEGMDIRVQDGFLLTLAGLHEEEGSTLLFVTHRIDIAARHATHVALVSDGRLASGPVREVLTPARLAAAFGSQGEVLGNTLAADRRLESC